MRGAPLRLPVVPATREFPVLIIHVMRHVAGRGQLLEVARQALALAPRQITVYFGAPCHILASQAKQIAMRVLAYG